MDPQKIEDKLDKVAAGNTEIQMDLGGVKFQTMLEVMEFAKLMSLSQAAVPPHLRNNPGACLAICTKALRFRFDPFALAEHSFAMWKEHDVVVESGQGGRTTQKQKVETIAYDSYVIRAIINAWAPIKGSMEYSYAGDGDERTCTVSATRADNGKVVSLTSPTLGKRKADIGTSEKGYLKGSPLWTTKPDQQLSYDTARDLCRREFPEIIMGWYDKDEFEESVRAAVATDVTPASGLKDRLKGQKGAKGFSPENTAQLPAPTERPLDTSIPDAKKTEPELVSAEKTPEATKPAEPLADPAPLAQEVIPEGDKPDETAEWLDEQIATANNVKTLDALDELDPAVWKRLRADNREKDLGPIWEASGYNPNKARLGKKTKK